MQKKKAASVWSALSEQHLHPVEAAEQKADVVSSNKPTCCRQADGLPPLVALLRGGPRNEAAACAAGALANLVANNGINQDAAADAAAVEEVVALLSAALADSACDRQVPLDPAEHCVV